MCDDMTQSTSFLALQAEITAVKRIAARSCGGLAAEPRTERVLRAMLLGALYRVPSISRLCDAVGEDLLFGWFMDLDDCDGPLSAREIALDCRRMVADGTARAFFSRVAALARDEGIVLPLAA